MPQVWNGHDKRVGGRNASGAKKVTDVRREGQEKIKEILIVYGKL
jgi:hypothetical protein